MKHHGTLAGTLALAAALLIGSPVTANDPELKEKDGDLRKELRELREELAAMRSLHRANNLTLRLLDERLSRLEDAMGRLSSSGVITRGAGAFDPRGLVATGTIRLDNRLAVPATVVIDGVAYSVPAFSVRTLTGRPAGMITYEVTALGFGMSAPVRTPVNPNQTLTLTIH
jgi:hypothetical protein